MSTAPLSPEPYPLLTRPCLLTKVWGGDRLAALGKAVVPGDRIGESWEVADLATTSGGGAGGGAIRSEIVNGPFAGRDLHEVLERWGSALVGGAARSPEGGYPLLVKYLDARENLSVQVHPSPAYAAANPGAYVKSECWLVLAAEPGARIYAGLKPGVTRGEFERAVVEGRTVDLMRAVPAVPCECHNVPSGTCHALGAGVLVLEVQTASDTTFRVYDWGRTDRELHVRQALACIDFEQPPPPPVRLEAGPLRTPNFSLRRVRIGPEGLALRDHPGIFCITEGRGELRDWALGEANLPLVPGQTGISPIGIGAARLVGREETPLDCVLATVA